MIARWAFVGLLAAGCASEPVATTDAGVSGLDASAVDASPAVGRDADVADALAPDALVVAEAPDADVPDALVAAPDASTETYALPVDLAAPWSSTGTAIPDRSALLAGCRVDVAAAGADLTAALSAAIAEASARPEAARGRCAVGIPAGTWTVSSTLDLPSGVVLVGAGSARTRLDFALGGRVTPLVRARGTGGVALSARGDGLGGALGDRTFAVTATIAQAVSALLAQHGRLYAEVSQDNDPALFPARWEQAYAARGIGQLAAIVQVGPADITLDRPLSEHYLPGSGFTKHLDVRAPGQIVERVGLMDLSLRRVEEAHDSSVFFDLTAGAFVVRVEGLDTGWSHVAIDRSLACEVRQSWFHGAHGHGDGGRAYGVNLRSHTTGCRVEDNAFDDLRHAMIVQLGASQNVYGYNFSDDSHDDLGVTKADISGHGHHAHLNLFEGNDVELAHVSDWHGPTPRFVLFKNRARTLGIYVDDASERIALIDNVAESVLGPRFALRIDGSVRRVICVGNTSPSGAPLVASMRGDCDNARAHDPRPGSFYRAEPLRDPASGLLPARVRRESGAAVPQP